ncbi:MAG TPA: DUF5060 domain-containing protein, partial [Armatimonadota bacterium]|nr:DUF5060 domain-containing protein [Armatimonadota bacterium]
MQRIVALVLVLLLFQGAFASSPYSSDKPLAIKSITAERSIVPQYERFELTVNLSASYANPFDPDDVLLSADFTSPRGQHRRIDGFLFRSYTRSLVNGREVFSPAGDPTWKIRFTPDVAGVWQYQVSARDRSGTVRESVKTFRVTSSALPGFIRRSTKNSTLFAYDNGTPFIPIGLNVCWGGRRGTFDYDDWLSALGTAGGNWIRVWMNSWNCALEWSADEKSPQQDGYHGAGVYNLVNAWKLDSILDIAARNHITVMLCLGTYGEFTVGGYFHEGQWLKNPYNAANGGPCANAQDFWTDQTARNLYRRRLHYLAARYGCYTNLQAWEFWNEAQAPADWVGEMARYLKGTGEFAGTYADPYRHLVTTTYGNTAVWKIPEVDFTQSHSYGTGNIPDHAPVIAHDANSAFVYGKPHLMAEFGIDWRQSDKAYDLDGTGTNLHNGIWASLASGNAGSAMIWWWDDYVAPKKLFGQLSALRTFANTIPWNSGVWSPLTFDQPTAEAQGKLRDLILPAAGSWGKASESELTILPYGVKGNSIVPGYLYSVGKQDLRTPFIFHVDYSQAGQFILRVNTVSSQCRLCVMLDGKILREIPISAVPPTDTNVKPEYERTEFKPEWNIYQAA